MAVQVSVPVHKLWPRLRPGLCEGDPPLVDFPGSHRVPRARVRAPGVELEAETRMSQEVEADPRTTRGGTRSGASSIAVLLLWLGMWAADLAYVAHFGSNVPYRDDWDMVPTVTGVQPVTAGWLWSQHNEHRIPVPRLLTLALYRTFGFDFRVGMVFNVCVTAVLALGLIQVARRLRGRASLADAFFPLVLLNWGQGINFIWGWQVEFYLSTALAGAVLLVLATSGDRPSLASLGTIWVLLVLLVGCGAHGVALVPGLAAWLGYCGLARLRSGGPGARRDGLLILAMASSALALVLLYFVGYSPVPYHPSTRNPLRIVDTGIKFLTMGFGPSVRAFWPLSGLLTLGLLAAGLATLISAARDRPPDRHRALGFLCFLGAMGSLTLAVGMGRDGFEPRYVTLSVPTLCCLFLASFLSMSRTGRYLRAAMAVMAALCLWGDTTSGIAYGTKLREEMGLLEREIEAGDPPYLLIHRHHDMLHPSEDLVSDYMPLLRRAGVGAFKHLRDDPPFREVPVPLVPSGTKDLRWEGGTAHGSGPGSYVDFALPADLDVGGIRIRYLHSNPKGTPPSSWSTGGAETSRDSRRTGTRSIRRRETGRTGG